MEDNIFCPVCDNPMTWRHGHLKARKNTIKKGECPICSQRERVVTERGEYYCSRCEQIYTRYTRYAATGIVQNDRLVKGRHKEKEIKF